VKRKVTMRYSFHDESLVKPDGHRQRVPVVQRVAVLSDVHGNAVALEAVLRDVAEANPDLVVFGGDLTWGPLPKATRALVDPFDQSALFLRGNAERALAEAAALDGSGSALGAREQWLLRHHSPDLRTFVAGFIESAVVDIHGLGAVRFCHGSPRSDEELITFATPEERMRALLEGVGERVLVSAHTHVQFDRQVAGIRSVNPGSVGMPYEGRRGAAFWALLGPDVELKHTDYDLDEAVRRYRETDYPRVEEMVEILVEPPAPAEVVEHAERLAFSG
jgi:predicted phosphodiesterase